MTKPTIGWIGMGRMGFPMAERLVKAGYDVKVWNRTRSKAEPLAEQGAVLVDSPADLAGVDVLTTMVSTGKDVEALYFGENGVLTGKGVPGIFLDMSSIWHRPVRLTSARASLKRALSLSAHRFLATANA